MAAALMGEMGSRTTERERRLHIFSVNLNGLKTNDKNLLKKLKNENREVDVVFLAETHVKDRDDWNIFRKDWNIFFTCYDSRPKGSSGNQPRLEKGVAIMVNKKRDFELLNEEIDKGGRYVIVNCWISGTLCTFVSVYHRSDERGLLNELSDKIKPLNADILVVGGDFNTALDEKKDTTSPHDNNDYYSIRKELLPFMVEHKLIDAWRKKHPDYKEYTHEHKFSGETYYSRLDYFFINADKWKLVQDCRINKDKISDHQSVSLILDLKDFQIFSTVQNLPKDEDLAKLCPDIILLTMGQANKDYIKKMKEEEEKTKVKKWNVLWSDDSNAAILVAERQRGIQILFTVYHENYVTLHCIVLGMLHTFVSACRPAEENLKKMLREIMHSYSGRIVIGGDFSTTDKSMELMEKHGFKNLKDGSMQLPYLIHTQLDRTYEIKEQEISDRSYFSLILHLPTMKTEDVDNITQSLWKLKIHCCFSAAIKKNEENLL